MEPTWPPPPNLPGGQADYETLLTSWVLAPSKHPLTQIHLCAQLRRATGMELRQCWLLVKDFCNHHGILTPPRGVRTWLPLLAAMMPLGSIVLLFINLAASQRLLATAQTQAARHLILMQAIKIDIVVLCLLVLNLCVTIIRLPFTRRQQQRAMEEARRILLAEVAEKEWGWEIR